MIFQSVEFTQPPSSGLRDLSKAFSMAFAAPVSHSQVHGHKCFIPYSKEVQSHTAVKTFQEQRIQFCSLACNGSYGDKMTRKRCAKAICSAALSEDVQDSSTESGERSSGSSAEAPMAEAPSSSPFVGAKISSRIAGRTAEANKSKTPMTVPTPSTSVPKPSTSSIPKVTSPFGTSTAGKQPVSAAKKLKNTRPSVFLDSKAGPRLGGSQLGGPNKLLNALNELDAGGKSTKFGQPVVPTNLFDEPKQIPKEEKKFEFSLNPGQLVLIFSFLTIISLMLGTAFLVWKVGGIHFNEY